MQVWSNCQVLSEQTSNSSAFLNVMCLVHYVLNCEQHFSFSIFRFGLSDSRISEGLLLYSSPLKMCIFICNECIHTSVRDGSPIPSRPAHVAKCSKKKENFSKTHSATRNVQFARPRCFLSQEMTARSATQQTNHVLAKVWKKCDQILT
jgi:hypothetical protein